MGRFTTRDTMCRPPWDAGRPLFSPLSRSRAPSGSAYLSDQRLAFSCLSRSPLQRQPLREAETPT